MIDLRSDTVTKPSDRMRAAMAAAEVGDDVYGEDPTVNRLQERAAELFEKEAALFIPSGTMGNQIAVKVHTKPGQEVVIEERGHILNYELGASAIFAGVTIRPVKSADGSGMLTWSEIAEVLSTDGIYDHTQTGLICLENTHNLAGGTVMPAGQIGGLCDRSHSVGIPVHMDGARIFNAATALNESVADLTRNCDSVQFCLSKGLGAPVGSILLGSREFINEARIWRKRLGGGMRQAGILAAAGLIALEESPKRLHEDHENARRLAAGLADLPGIGLDPDRIVTNIVIFDIAGTGRTANEICNELRDRGVLTIGFGTKIRMVTHCDVTRQDVDAAVAVMRDICG
ncbi:MAG: low-specificity L-threonine aldolase [Pyrinomonadaceae bacterium]|nr:low-specificity L-threonine aldolase [Pyrinomonadaceae bacterium]